MFEARRLFPPEPRALACAAIPEAHNVAESSASRSSGADGLRLRMTLRAWNRWKTV